MCIVFALNAVPTVPAAYLRRPLIRQYRPRMPLDVSNKILRHLRRLSKLVHDPRLTPHERIVNLIKHMVMHQHTPKTPDGLPRNIKRRYQSPRDGLPRLDIPSLVDEFLEGVADLCELLDGGLGVALFGEAEAGAAGALLLHDCLAGAEAAHHVGEVVVLLLAHFCEGVGGGGGRVCRERLGIRHFWFLVFEDVVAGVSWDDVVVVRLTAR
jgi:hypothetical protein